MIILSALISLNYDVIPFLIPQVSKYTLNQEKLKSKYNQIVAFYFISNKTKAGINELVNRLIDTTLREKYMGEAIPVK